MTLRRFLSLLVFTSAIASPSLHAAETALEEKKDLLYKTDGQLTEYEQRRCLLDVYAPAGAKDLPCLLWFHGGGITGGDKSGQVKVCRVLAGEGFVVAAANYRLSPEAKFPAYLDDAAAASAWLKQHAAEFGGDSARVFVGGHSAGAYLTAMVALDPQYLQKHGLTPKDFAGFIPDSSQMTTHFAVKAERGIGKLKMIVDEAAPLHHVTRESPPMLAFYAEHDMAFRREENQLFLAAYINAGNRRLKMLEIPGHDHGSICGRIAEEGDPVRVAMVEFMRGAPGAR